MSIVPRIPIHEHTHRRNGGELLRPAKFPEIALALFDTFDNRTTLSGWAECSTAGWEWVPWTASTNPGPYWVEGGFGKARPYGSGTGNGSIGLRLRRIASPNDVPVSVPYTMTWKARFEEIAGGATHSKRLGFELADTNDSSFVEMDVDINGSLELYSFGGTSPSDSYAGPDLNGGAWFLVKAEVTTTAVSGKVWLATDAEPAWQVTIGDGGVGYAILDPTSTNATRLYVNGYTTTPTHEVWLDWVDFP